jgi:flagella basal body P-ring formation protein FlgA
MRTLLTALIVTAAAGANCLTVEHDRIAAGDLALAEPGMRSVKPDIIFGYAPQPGAVRQISGEELRRFAAAHGVVLANAADLCVEHPVRALDPMELLRAMKDTIGSEARIDIVDFSRVGVPRGRLVFARGGLTLPVEPTPDPLLWRGQVEYGQGRRTLVWARVRITETRTELVATRDLRPGEIVARGDIRLETGEVGLSRRSSLSSFDTAEGMIVRRSIPAGTPLRAEWLQPPEVVRRGDQVPVTVVSASAVLRLHARAESGARAGQRVMLTNLENGKRFEALVDRRGEALLQIGGDAK